jgi:hypothetical protein
MDACFSAQEKLSVFMAEWIRRSKIGLNRRLPACVIAVVPLACAWAKRQETLILRSGVGLSGAQAETAKGLGILHADRVRLLAVRQVPPINRLSRRLGEKLGFIDSEIIGMTLRYGIFIRADHWGDRRLLVHELVHVAQYERLNGFGRFLSRYLQECIDPGYPFGELEQEANRAESACS